MLLNEVFAAQQVGFPILSALIVLPLAGLALIAAAPERWATTLGLGTAVLEFLLTLLLLGSFRAGTADLQFVEHWGGIYRLGIDGISALFLPLTALITGLAVLCAGNAVRVNLRGYVVALLGFEAAVMGVLVAADAALFWIFLVLEILPSWLLIAQHGTGTERRQTGRHFALMMGISSVAMACGLWMLTAATGGDSSLKSISATSIPAQAQGMMFLCLVFGLGIRLPLFPLHAWLPRVLDQGPVVGVSVLMVGVKLGAYGFLRWVIPYLPEATLENYWWLGGLAATGVVYGALIALRQTNLRRLLAYASVSHAGVVMLGLLSLNSYGIQGGLLQTLCLGMAVAGLYFLAGFLYQRVGPPEVGVLGALRQQTPVLSAAFLVIALGAIGMPGTSGFNGEHLVLIGAYKVHWVMALFVGAGTVLGAAYFLWFYQRAFLSVTDQPKVDSLPDLTLRERCVAGTLAGLVLTVGLYTSPFITITQSSVSALSEHLKARTAHLERGTASKQARLGEGS